jgi:hypothetical protein
MREVLKRLDIAVVLSLVSLFVAIFSLFWNVRPARIEPVMNAVYASRQSGMHLSIPLSIVNSGARPETVLAAKLIESSGNAQVVWSAIFAANATHALSVATGDIRASNVMPWMPFIVPGNGEVQEVVVFEPFHDGRLPLVASGRTVSYRIVLLLGRDTEATTSAEVTWPPTTNRILAAKKGGVGFVTTDIYKWSSEGTP